MGIGDLVGASVMSVLMWTGLIYMARAVPHETGVRLRLGRMIVVSALAYCGVMAFYLVVQYLYHSEERREAIVRAIALGLGLGLVCFFMVFALAAESIRQQKGCGRLFWRPDDAADAAEADENQ